MTPDSAQFVTPHHHVHRARMHFVTAGTGAVMVEGDGARTLDAAASPPGAPVSPSPSRIHRRRGVTLIELAIVVVIIGVVAAIALPRLNVAGYEADGAARAVSGAIMRAQRTAVQRQYAVHLAFDTARRRMRIVEDTNMNGVIEALDRATWLPLPEKARFAAPATALAGAPAGTGAVRGPQLRQVLGLPGVTFLRHGGATSEAVAYVQALARGRVERRAVTLAGSTGRPETFRFIDDTWRRGGP